MDHTFESPDRRCPLQSQTFRLLLALATPNSETESDLRLYKQLRRMVAKEARHRCVRHTYEVTQQAVENGLSINFIPRIAEIEDDVQKFFYQYIESILTVIAGKERWARSSTTASSAGRSQLCSLLYLPSAH